MFNPNQQPQNVQNITTPYPNCPILDPSGKTSLAWEQFFRRLHLRTGNAIGVNSSEIKETAEAGLQTAIDAKAIADICLGSLFILDENLNKSNLSIQGIYSGVLNNQALILAILSQLGETLSILQSDIQTLKNEIEEMKGNTNGV